MDKASDLTELITATRRQAPRWIQAEMISRDTALRARAEDALAAILANAIAETRSVTVEQPIRH